MQFTYSVRVGDINFGNHLAHDKLITILHDARAQWLHAVELSEMNFMGVGLILRELNVKYHAQAFLHQNLSIIISITEMTPSKLMLEYAVSSEENRIATAYTELLFYDYTQQKVYKLDIDELKQVLSPLLEP